MNKYLKKILVYNNKMFNLLIYLKSCYDDKFSLLRTKDTCYELYFVDQNNCYE